jgi:hypothetical protein
LKYQTFLERHGSKYEPYVTKLSKYTTFYLTSA